MTLNLGCWTSHLEPATGLMSVWCLVATLQTVCHQKTCSLVPATCMEPVHINPSLLSQFQEDRKRVGGVRGHSSPVEAPGDSYVTETRPTKKLSLQRSHGGGARGISSWAGAVASAVVVGLATLVQPAFGPKWQGSRQIMGQQIFSKWSRLHNCQKTGFPVAPTPPLSLPLSAVRLEFIWVIRNKHWCWSKVNDTKPW